MANANSVNPDCISCTCRDVDAKLITWLAGRQGASDDGWEARETGWIPHTDRMPDDGRSHTRTRRSPTPRHKAKRASQRSLSGTYPQESRLWRLTKRFW